MINNTRLYASPFGSNPAAKISKRRDVAAKIDAVALWSLTSLSPALIRSIPGSDIISLLTPLTIASSFQREERRTREVIALSAAINAGVIDTISIGIQSKIINVGLVSG